MIWQKAEVGIEKIEAERTWYSQERPIAPVLPSLYSELEGEALTGIVREGYAVFR
jgi:glucosyl-3-phosphoglycerate synthase